MKRNSGQAALGDQHLSNRPVEGIGHGGVFRLPGFKGVEKGDRTAAGEVYELIRDHQVSGPDILPERAYSGGGHHPGAIQGHQGRDMGPVVHESRGNPMLPAVSGHQSHLRVADSSHPNRRMRRAPGGGDGTIPGVLENVGVVQPASADDADHEAFPSGWSDPIPFPNSDQTPPSVIGAVPRRRGVTSKNRFQAPLFSGTITFMMRNYTRISGNRNRHARGPADSLEIRRRWSHALPMPVYVNRLLNFKKIRVVGFDMDYTLVPYGIEAFEGLVHSLAVTRLVEKLNYPEAVAELRFHRERAIVGLVIDKLNGNLLKLSRFGKVKMAFHGLDPIDFREQASLYRERVIDLRDPDYESLDTAFAISNGVLYAQLVQLKKEGTSLPDYRRIDADVGQCIDSLHKDGSIKALLKRDFKKYVIQDPRTAQMLERLKIYGKKLIIITNSDYNYTRDLLDYSLDPYWKNHRSWRDVFDLVITFAEKPRFFEGRHPFLRIEPGTGVMSNHEGPVSGGIWQGGWFGDVQEGLGVAGNEILYLGDHIYGDVVSIKKRCDWRTGLVLGGLEKEIEAIRSTRKLQAEIDRLMDRKSWLEKEADQAEMDRRFGGSARVTESHAEEQDRLNARISELLDRLRPHFNPWWGEILRAGSEESRYADQMESYACIYMTRVSDLADYSPRTYFRPRRRTLAHEAAEAE